MDHVVQLYQKLDGLADAVVEYIGAGLARGEGAVIIATPEHGTAFLARLSTADRSRLKVMDAEQTLATFMVGGRPQWQAFRQVIGGLIAEMRLQYPAVCAYGEMVDVLWQRGERDAAIRLEEFWNDLAKLQTFSLLCAYYMDNLDAAAYHGPLECICKVHTHLIPARDYEQFNQAVIEASKEALDAPLADMLLSLSERHRPPTAMPQGQATLLWLQRNMPRTAEKVLTGVRSRSCWPGSAPVPAASPTS